MMATKSLTQGKPTRTRAQLDAYTGKPDIYDEHPLISCTPTKMGGHAHLRSNKTTVERVLLAELRHIEGPLRMSSGLVLTEQERRAVFRYAIDVMENLSKLYAELGRLRAITPSRRTADNGAYQGERQ